MNHIFVHHHYSRNRKWPNNLIVNNEKKTDIHTEHTLF